MSNPRSESKTTVPSTLSTGKELIERLSVPTRFADGLAFISAAKNAIEAYQLHNPNKADSKTRSELFSVIEKGLDTFYSRARSEWVKADLYQVTNEIDQAALAYLNAHLITPSMDTSKILEELNKLNKQSQAVQVNSDVLPVVLAYFKNEWQGSWSSKNTLNDYAAKDNFLATILLARLYEQPPGLLGKTDDRQAMIHYTKALMLASDPERMKAYGLSDRQLKDLTDFALIYFAGLNNNLKISFSNNAVKFENFTAAEKELILIQEKPAAPVQSEIAVTVVQQQVEGVPCEIKETESVPSAKTTVEITIALAKQKLQQQQEEVEQELESQPGAPVVAKISSQPEDSKHTVSSVKNIQETVLPQSPLQSFSIVKQPEKQPEPSHNQQLKKSKPRSMVVLS